MMDFWQSLNGDVTVRLTSADPAAALIVMEKYAILGKHIIRKDDLTLEFQVRRQDIPILKKEMENRGDSLKIIGKRGIYWVFRSLLRRPVLMIGLLLLLGFGLFLPTRVFFFRVEGNVTVPTKWILEQAAECGIRFGTSRQEVRSEMMKNALLSAIPELQWAGINTSGCVATISVRERQPGEEPNNTSGVSSIVAIRDGVIQQYTVTKGNGVCKPGQAVKAGQVLISGYTDCGLSIRATRAEGEIYAITSRELEVVVPLDWVMEGNNQEEIKKISLIIGKNRINFYQGSGILDTGCVKMYEENYLKLPGGFQLPVAIASETWLPRDNGCQQSSAEELSSFLSALATSYLKGQMIAGQILTRQEVISQEDGVIRLVGTYGCLEMIGQERNEEIVIP